MKIKSLTLPILCLLGSLYLIVFFHLNEVLKVADSYAYFQMAHELQQFSQNGLGSGWFGFVYSIPLAFFGFVFQDDFLAFQITNLIFLNISALLLYHIARKILPEIWSYVVVGLFFLSPTLLHFHIHILSENVYIPLFLGLFLLVYNFIENNALNHSIKNRENISHVIVIGIFVGLMYLTRAEAFIYLGSIGLIALWMLIKKHLSVKQFFGSWLLCVMSFFIFISPYLFHLHSLSGEWGLTNKGASNLRQAELRGRDKMDDTGFEQAVAELTPDNSQLIAGFAGGMSYVKPQISGSLGSFIRKDPQAFIERIVENQIKLFTKNLPEIFLGKTPSLYFGESHLFGRNHIFLLLCLIPLGVLVYGIVLGFQKQRNFLLLSLAFFLPACFFFTLFFTLNRYFLIFLPFILIFFTLGVQKIISYKKILGFSALVLYVMILLLSTKVYYSIEAPKDEYYALKKAMGEWMSRNIAKKERTIMERFPVVTYYAGAPLRYITPYNDDIERIIDYGLQNNIHYLIVDSMDFLKYRPSLSYLLETTPTGLQEIVQMETLKGEKVILYKIIKKI